MLRIGYVSMVVLLTIKLTPIIHRKYEVLANVLQGAIIRLMNLMLDSTVIMVALVTSKTLVILMFYLKLVVNLINLKETVFGIKPTDC